MNGSVVRAVLRGARDLAFAFVAFLGLMWTPAREGDPGAKGAVLFVGGIALVLTARILDELRDRLPPRDRG